MGKRDNVDETDCEMFREHSSSARFSLLRLFEGGRRGIELLTFAVEYETERREGTYINWRRGEIFVPGNLFVIAAILLERNLQSVANYLIVSLAVADLMVACLVMPLGAVYEVL